MGLCYICSGIPFENPPSLPPSYVRNLPGQPYGPGNPTLYFVESDDPNYNTPPYGYPHWTSEAQLARSARSCELCRLIHHEFGKNAGGAPPPSGEYNFFITRREHDQAGFVVWTQADRPMVIWRVGAFGYSVDHVDSPLAHNFTGRRVREHASDPEAQKIARQWLDHCVRYHTLCGPPGDASPRLPTRVLDLGSSSDSQIKLWETKGARHNYTTLSYMWGPESLGHAYKTTPSNIGRYEKGIDLVRDEIPKTIVDAIHITRHMGIRYLWVDALCIRQDDDHKDFNVEGVKMMDYYGNSYLTITAASSSDAYSGVFNVRDPSSYVTFHHTSRSGVHGMLIVTTLQPEKENIQADYLEFKGNPIITRAWTLQERVLSTRNIFYADDQMYYECNEHFVSEDGLRMPGRKMSTNPRAMDLTLFRDANTSLWYKWDELVGQYAARQMHDPKRNKFMAICGLAKRFGHLFHGGRYYAGLWKHKLIEQLFWTTNIKHMPEGTRRQVWHHHWPPAREDYRAPSWSWASMDMGIINPDGRIHLAELYATHENSSFNFVQDDEHGQISHADLNLSAPMVRLQYLRGYRQEGEEAHDWAYYNDPAGANIAKSTSTVFDYEFHHAQLQGMDVFALVLGRDASMSQDGVNDVYYLSILVTTTETMAYRRMGVVWLQEHSMGDRAIRYVDRSNYDYILFV